MNKMKDILFILIVTGLYVIVANAVGYKGDYIDATIGAFFLVAIAAIGAFISFLPIFNKLPMVFWVSILAVVISIPGFPGGDIVVFYAKKINFLATTTPILAYGGLALGKDIPAFKQLSWRIIPVALGVASGTFICATLMAEVMLHFEGIF